MHTSRRDPFLEERKNGGGENKLKEKRQLPEVFQSIPSCIKGRKLACRKGKERQQVTIGLKTSTCKVSI